MLAEKKIGFIGGGNMGKALIGGLTASGLVRPENIICSDICEKSLAATKAEYGINTTTSNAEAIQDAEIVIFATKPQILPAVLKETAGLLDKSRLIISIAAGVPLAAISLSAGKNLRLIRVMPNLCALVKESATAIAAGEFVLDGDMELARAIFDSVGTSVFLQEELLDAFTGLSGSGPAYMFMMLDALADAGVKAGLSREDSRLLSAQTMLGAAKMMLESGEHPGLLKDKVTSPGGTSIAGIQVLEQAGLRAAMIDCVEAASDRSRELGCLTAEKFQDKPAQQGEGGIKRLMKVLFG
ncbi:MAG: pyrroline-5-carboxylate reductase [Deltaproteobacteria bacterium]|nr:MAG: pyrroline-5-carboxylate reductase [Deltaproteobacteria bacterium]